MRRPAAILMAAGLLIVMVAGPAAADYPDGYSPIIPWHQDTVEVSVDEINDFGARWGACTRGLAQAAARHLDVVVTVDGEPVGPAEWSRPVNPDHTITTFPLAEACTASSHGDTGWWVFWNQPLAFSEPGIYEVSVTMTATNPVHDGAGMWLEAGWALEGGIEVTVVTE